jgi:Zonular occludens toxin (Zot)
MFHNGKKRARRRGWPIHAYVGANGGGKSAGMVWDTLPSLDAGRTVLSTVRLLDYRNPRACTGYQGPTLSDPCDVCASADAPDHMQAHPMWVPFSEWEQLLAADHCDVLMDEVAGVASSRESQSMPSAVVVALQQCRRADLVVRWSAPNWSRADKIIRETSQAVTYCVGFLPKDASDVDRLWRQRRLFQWRTYDATQFEDFSVGKRQQMRPLVHDLHWGPRSPAFRGYDTLDTVLSIGTVSESGRCYRCGGTRRAPACKCEAPPASVLRGRRGPGSPRSGARGVGLDAPHDHAAEAALHPARGASGDRGRVPVPRHAL